MARIRSVKPEFFTSLDIADLSITARLMFIGLWTHADDEGRFVDEPRIVKGALFPLDDHITATVIEDILTELAANKRLIRYQYDGKHFAEIQGWHHQKIDRRTASKLPPPGALGELSPSARRGLDEASSPDQDRIGSDQDLSSSSDVTLTGHPPDIAEDDPRITAVLEAVADHKQANANPKNPTRWRRTVIRNDLRDHGDTIRRLIAEYPDAPATLLAGTVLGQDTRNLANYRRKEPATT